MKIKLKRLDLGLDYSKNRLFTYGLITIILLVGLIVLFWGILKKGETTYLVSKGTLEFSTLAEAYIIKDETIIERDTSKVLVPVVSEGQKAAKGGIIATYKNEEYDTKAKELEKLDKEILDLMQNLPIVYSGEIESVENQIRTKLKSAINTTSYVEMQDYINVINGLVNKRAIIIGQLSPSGQEISKLINQRNKFEADMKKTSDNVVATAQGIVSYTTDGLEEKLKTDKVASLSFDDVRQIVKTGVTESNIKLINNFYCYVICRTKSVNEEYIKSNSKYKLKIIGDNTTSLDAKLISYIIKKDDGIVDLVFEIKNNIEQIAFLRALELEIVWWTNTGLYVPTQAIKNTGIVDYVRVLKHGKQVEIPIKIVKSNGKNSIVENFTSDELKELNITSTETLKLYDNIVVK